MRGEELVGVLALCAACPVRSECLAYALERCARLGIEGRRTDALVAQGQLIAQVIRGSIEAAFAALLACAVDGRLEATTDPFRVLEFAERPGPLVVFATYQSSNVVAEAGVDFDLTIADEAHHLAGEVDKHYAAIVRGEISTQRILYMTATPRQFRRRKVDVDLVGMEDEKAFGRRVFEFPLSDAVEAGVVADYRVIVAAVERDVFERVARRLDDSDVDPHLLAGAIAVVRAMGELGLASCLSFHTRVDRARSFIRRQRVADIEALIADKEAELSELRAALDEAKALPYAKDNV